MKRSDLRRVAACLLLPVVRFFVRRALKIQELLDLAKRLYLEVAREEIMTAGLKVTDSRLSVITGMHRRDVRKFASAGEASNEFEDLVTKVVGRWQVDHDFTTKQGTPRVLSIGGVQSEFAQLVQAVSKDLNPATVLYECERVGVVERSPHGVRLVLGSYTPRGDSEANFSLLSTDLDSLIGAVEENVFSAPEISNLHAHTIFDKVRPEALPEIRRWLLREGHALHARAREFISQHDQDINPSAEFKGPVARVVFGTFAKAYEAAPVVREKEGDDE